MKRPFIHSFTKCLREGLTLKSYLPTQEGGVTRGLGLVGASGPAHIDMITLTHSQLLPASVHPVPARDVSAIEVKLLNVDELSGSLFNPLHARSRARLLATYLPTYRAPRRREKATYLLFGSTGIELRSSRKDQTQLQKETRK